MSFIFGFIAAIVIIAVIGAIFMNRMGKFFFLRNKSRLNFEDTLKTIRERIEDNTRGWFTESEKDFNLAYQKKQKGELPFRLTVFKIGNSDLSYRVNSAFPAVSTFMPAAIAVVGRKDGSVDIYRKNTGMMGFFFSGVVKEVMGKEVSIGLNEILTGAI
ncbi:MAG TPA: hypothetical protein ENH12_08125 [Proteobacteria bacterium]|nr:hypothetical protein [Pseudomonadota bacterium]